MQKYLVLNEFEVATMDNEWVNLSDCLCQQLKPHDDFHLYF